MQFNTKAVLDSLLKAVDFVFPSRFWLPKSSDSTFNGVSEFESAVLDSKGIDSTVNNHKYCEFWNPDYFTLRDHHIVLRLYFSIAQS